MSNRLFISQELIVPEFDAISAFRKHLHKNPELSNGEFRTAASIVDYCQQLKPDQIMKTVGGTGVAVVFDSGRSGPGTLFRAELDALPIQEVNDLAHRSCFDGVSHKCGHDGHMAILLALGKQLSERRPASGKVMLAFQPAEETGEGANRYVYDEAFS